MTDTTVDILEEDSTDLFPPPPDYDSNVVIIRYSPDGDTVFFDLNPDYIFTADGDIIYAGGGSYKAALDSTTISTLSLYPNPTSSNIYLEYTLYSESDIKLKVTNELGQELNGICEQNQYHQLKGKHKLTLHTSNLASGIYFCIIELNGTKEVRKFTVSK